MKFWSLFLAGMVIVSLADSRVAHAAPNHGIYYNELEALKTAPVTKLMFDEDAHVGLSKIQRDITIYKNLNFFQRYVRSNFLDLDVVMVTPETMPLLYSYVYGICKKANIATPSVFVTRQNDFFNAFAAKLLMSTGGIVIGQKLINELSDDAIEAVVAHEIGHIKYNHSNKVLALFFLKVIAYVVLKEQLDIQSGAIESDTDNGKLIKEFICSAKECALLIGVLCTGRLIINKRFEKEADEFACDANGKGAGLIEFFKLLLKKDQLREEEFAPIYALLQKNQCNLSIVGYYFLLVRYYLARGGQLYSNLYKKIYHETFIGAHPSPQARIITAKECLARQRA